jgi:CDP-diacylglycerol---glycerol-3-phosphate 3-phosphatidyltransferase
MLINIPNSLTISRAILIPFVVVFFYLPVSWGTTVAATIFAIACVTDWLDGYLARRLGEHSALGALLDPVVDKILVVVVLVMLVSSYQSIIVTLAAMIITSREIIISALREWMAEIGKKHSVVVSQLGKIKTCVQMLALVVMLANQPTSIWANFGCGLLIIAVIMTIWSMYIYLRQAKRCLAEP